MLDELAHPSHCFIVVERTITELGIKGRQGRREERGERRRA